MDHHLWLPAVEFVADPTKVPDRGHDRAAPRWRGKLHAHPLLHQDRGTGGAQLARKHRGTAAAHWRCPHRKGKRIRIKKNFFEKENKPNKC